MSRSTLYPVNIFLVVVYTDLGLTFPGWHVLIFYIVQVLQKLLKETEQIKGIMEIIISIVKEIMEKEILSEKDHEGTGHFPEALEFQWQVGCFDNFELSLSLGPRPM